MHIPENARTGHGVGLLALLLAFGLAFLFWRTSSTAELENNRRGAELQGLELERSIIERELDSLALAYQSVRQENENLHGQMSVAEALIAQKEAAIQRLKTRISREPEAVQKQVEELRRVKIEYETVIAAVSADNAQLRETNRQMKGENSQLLAENADLNDRREQLARQLAEQIRRTQSARFRATSFRVEVKSRNDKLTARARKAHEIYLRFDLTDVAEEYRSVQPLYLVVTDEKGRPIPAQNPLETTVQAPTGPVAIIAQQVKKISLRTTQRLSFSYQFDERIRPGNYVVAIYCPAGLLGAASFRLM